MALVLVSTLETWWTSLTTWIAVLFVDSKKDRPALIAKDGEKIAVSSKHETELVPAVWVQLVRGSA